MNTGLPSGPSAFQTLDQSDLVSRFSPGLTAIFEVTDNVPFVEFTMVVPDAGAVQLVLFGIDGRCSVTSRRW